jgi:hypothetical protein
MGTMLVIGMGPRNAGEGKTSPATSSSEKPMKKIAKSGMVMLPVSKFEMNDGTEDVSPEVGDSVELSGTIDMIENGIAHVNVEHAMSESESKDQSEDMAEGENSMSEEEKMMKLAEESDKENYS